MSLVEKIKKITSTIKRRVRAKQSVLIVVSFHSNTLSNEILETTKKFLSEYSFFHTKLRDINLHKTFEKDFDIFSLDCTNVSKNDLQKLNFFRNSWSELNKALILWIPSIEMEKVSTFASNFLDFRSTSISLEAKELNLTKESSFSIDIDHLPKPSTNVFVGRENYITNLRNALRDENINVISIVALGGAGKSTLIQKFLERIKEEDYFGATKILGWSFYSQGQHKTFTSSTTFFERALDFFECEDRPINEDEKAKRVLSELQKEKFILILDGVEPLQESSIEGGKINDIGLRTLLLNVKKKLFLNGGLIIITSRQNIIELQNTPHYLEYNLEHLDSRDSQNLFKSFNISSTKELKGHALSLTLYAKLKEANIKGKELIFEEAKSEYEQVFKILDIFTKEKLSENQILFLYLIALFDRPAEKEVIKVLRKKASIAKKIKSLSTKNFEKLVNELEDFSLINIKKEVYDSHPLIREYFLNKFKEVDYKSFLNANEVLFKYFQSLPSKYQPDTLDDMLPLFRAVYHGALAEKYEEALDIHYIRINKEEGFSIHSLGAISLNLYVLSIFNKDVLNINDSEYLISTLSFIFMKMGKLDEALKYRIDTMKININLANYYNLIWIYILLGDFDKALKINLEYLKKIKNDNLINKIRINVYFGFLHYEQNNLKEVIKYFKNAEESMKTLNYSFVTGFMGIYYAELLLDMAKSEYEIKKVLERVNYILKDGENNKDLVSISFAKALFSKIYLRLLQKDKARIYINEAITTIRKSNAKDNLPKILLTRAFVYLKTHKNSEDLNLIESDLDEVKDIIEYGNMRLYEKEYNGFYEEFIKLKANK